MAAPVFAAVAIGAQIGKLFSSFGEASRRQQLADRKARAIEDQSYFRGVELYGRQDRVLAGKFYDALERGDLNSRRVIESARSEGNSLIARARAIVGQQKGEFAAQGIDVSSGTAAILAEQANFKSRLDDYRIFRAAADDAAQIRNNAWKEAWGIGETRYMGAIQNDMMLKAAKEEAFLVRATGDTDASTLRWGAALEFGKEMSNYFK